MKSKHELPANKISSKCFNLNVFGEIQLFTIFCDQLVVTTHLCCV